MQQFVGREWDSVFAQGWRGRKGPKNICTEVTPVYECAVSIFVFVLFLLKITQLRQYQ